MTYSWQNADGEPIMSGEAWRFEQQLDMEIAEERYNDWWQDDDYPECTNDPTDLMHDGWSYNDEGLAECDWCGLRLPQHDEGYDGAPLYRDGMGPDDPVRCDND